MASTPRRPPPPPTGARRRVRRWSLQRLVVDRSSCVADPRSGGHRPARCHDRSAAPARQPTHGRPEPRPRLHAAAEAGTCRTTSSPRPRPAASRTPAPRYTIKATVCGMEYVRPLDPPGEQHHTVCWVQHDFGFAPGSNGRGTTYVLGHSWGQDAWRCSTRSPRPRCGRCSTRGRHGTAHLVSGIPTYQVTALTAT